MAAEITATLQGRSRKNDANTNPQKRGVKAWTPVRIGF